jgi:hypothetical protein
MLEHNTYYILSHTNGLYKLQQKQQQEKSKMI